jgi:basic amino acid/polyamine antiporter, APA family
MSNAFNLNLAGGIGITLLGLAFMAVVALVNFRGVGESVKANVLLTCVELSGLLIIIFIGLWAIGAGAGDVSRVLEFRTSGTGSMLWPVIAATTLAFFAMVGFEDSVNIDPTVTVCRDRVHDAPGLRPDHLRRRGSGARRHDRFVAAGRLHRR